MSWSCVQIQKLLVGAFTIPKGVQALLNYFRFLLFGRLKIVLLVFVGFPTLYFRGHSLYSFLMQEFLGLSFIITTQNLLHLIMDSLPIHVAELRYKAQDTVRDLLPFLFLHTLDRELGYEKRNRDSLHLSLILEKLENTTTRYFYSIETLYNLSLMLEIDSLCNRTS